MSVLSQLAHPPNWLRVRLGSVARRQQQTDRPDLPLLSVFLGVGVVPRDERQDNFNTVGADLGKYQVAEPGDIVFNKLRTWQGGFGVSRYEGIVSPAYIIARPDRALLEPRYLHHLLRSQPYLAELTRLSKWMPPSQFDIAWEDIRSLELALPPLAEQRRIADFLDDQTARIDQIITARQRQMRLLGEMVLEFSRQITTVGDAVVIRDTGIDWMPQIAADWGLMRVSQLFRTGSGTTPTADNPAYFDGDIPWVNTGEVCDADITRTSRSVTNRALRDFPALRVHDPGSLVIAMYGQGATKGRVGILRIAACVNQACSVLASLGLVNSDWAAAWFKAHKRHIVELAMGSGQPNLNQEIIRSLRLPVPPQKEQRSLLSMLKAESDRAASLTDAIGASIRVLSEFKRSLISAAVSRDFDVTTATGRGLPA